LAFRLAAAFPAAFGAGVVLGSAFSAALRDLRLGFSVTATFLGKTGLRKTKGPIQRLGFDLVWLKIKSTQMYDFKFESVWVPVILIHGQ